MDTIPQDAPQDKAASKSVWIYALIDPTTQQVRYIGKSVNPHRRFLAHLRDKEETHKARWIRALQSQGLTPQLQILEETTAEMWIEREISLIAFYRAQGYDLTNISSGGQGDTGHPKTPEHKAKIGAAQLGRKHSPESIAKTVAGKRGKKLPPRTEEYKNKISAAHRGRKHSPEHIAKFVAATRGRKPSPETRAKLSEARKGKKRGPMSEEQKRKLSIIRKKQANAIKQNPPDTPTLWDHAV